MQTLYGIKITDRAAVNDRGVFGFEALFDGQVIGTFSSGREAVHGIVEHLQQRQKDRDEEARRESIRREAQQESDDGNFLHDLATRLGVDPSDLDVLIEIANRRAVTNEQ